MFKTSFSRAMSTMQPKKAGLIFLHGLGDTPLGWSGIEDALPELEPQLSQVEYVFPPAPTIPISINGGATMPGWFDLYDWPIGVGVKDDREGKLKGVEQIEECIAKLEEKGIPRSKIVVGGFSQGGAIALLTAYHSDAQSPARKPLAGCASLSGWLTLTQEEGYKTVNTETPLFWAHGQFDDKVLFEQQAHGVNLLTGTGVSVQAENYPMGHSSHPDEMQAFAKFLTATLFDEKGSGEL